MENDDRFKHIKTDPKFRRIPKSERKVKIDKRFQSMFSDEKFKIKYTVDKRGRPVNHTSTEDLKRYYELNSDEESDENESVKSELKPEESQDLIKKKNGDKSISIEIKNKLKDLSVDYARGEASVATDSSSDDEDSEEDYSDSEVDHGWGELDKDAPTTEEATKRLAVCNQDWDRIRAVDIMVLFNSFVPTGGLIHSVTIYPSDFGMERMKEEETKGPVELMKKSDDESDEETEEGSKYHMEKLRQYQLNRLKYYYAVVTCDSVETANKIYSECDGMEYESSATKVDLRFIPDDMEFDNNPKETCDKMPEKYEPRFFTTTALQQAKVELTWDETNPERLEITKKFASGKIDDVTETDLQAYLASSSEEDSETEEKDLKENLEDDTKNPIDKYRALLLDIENNEKGKDDKGIEMEISWGLNVKEKANDLVKKKLAEKEDKTPFQQFLDKRKEKKKAKRAERKKKGEDNVSSDEESDIPSDIDMNDPYFAEEFDKSEFKKKKSKKKLNQESNDDFEQEKAELELLLLDENEDNRKHFNMKKIQEKEGDKLSKKRKKRNKVVEESQEDEFEVDVRDDRFSALFSSHHYNIDPTDSRYKKTKGMEAIIEEKMKRRTNEDEIVVPEKKKPKKDVELSVLVKSVKQKTKALGSRK